MRFTREKRFGAGIILAAALCLFAPQKIHASAAAVQPDGVMGQSLVDETDYKEGQQDLDSLILKAASRSSSLTLLGATSSYSTSFLNTSFTTDGDFTSATYYHKNDYEEYSLFNGIDVSWWQSVSKSKTDANYRKLSALDWSAVHDAGIDFAFVRVASRDNSAGTLYEDTCANAHITGAVENDINVGLYVFSQALTEDEAIEEAEYVLDLADQYGWDVTMPIVIDREAGTYKRLTAGKLSKAKETAVIQAFADTITGEGYQACVYASYTWIKNYIDTDLLEDCSVWLARYKNTTTSNTASGTAYSDVAYDYDFWQYSSTAKVSGYSGNLDVNFWYKDTDIQPENLKMKDNSTNSITISWSAAGDAQGYRVYRYDPEQDSYVYIASTDKKSYTDTGLLSATYYQYRVRGYWTIGGTNYYGAYADTLTAATVPAKVENVSIDRRTTTALTISWDEVDNASGYRIYQYNEDEDSYEKLADVAADETSYEISGLTSATGYRFQVKAYMESETDTYWGPASDACGGVTSPAALAELTVETKSSSSIALKWKKVSRATGYQIYRLNSANGKYEKVATVKGASKLTYTDSGLNAGKEYSYKVRAYKAYDGENYCGKFSAVDAAVTNPAKVSSLKLTAKSSSVTLAWSKVSGASGYQVYRLNTKTGKYEKIATVKGADTCTYKNTKLKKGTSYTYKVRAYRTYESTNYLGSFSTPKKIKTK